VITIAKRVRAICLDWDKFGQDGQNVREAFVLTTFGQHFKGTDWDERFLVTSKQIPNSQTIPCFLKKT